MSTAGPTQRPVSEQPTAPTPTRHHDILALGGGSGGITTAAQLCRKLGDPGVAIVEPSDPHYYQPLWTLVGAGVGVRDRSRVHSYAGTPGIFSVKAFAKTVNEVIARKGIETHCQPNLVEVRPDRHEAVFQDLERGEEVVQHYDLPRVTPPQGPPDVIKRSPLADEAGWASVDKHTLPHPDFPNVFSLGDVSSLPTSRPERPSARRRRPSCTTCSRCARARATRTTFKRHDGYSSCPLTTGYGKLVLAEFDYDLVPTPSFPFDTTKERWSMYQLKRYGLPALYWRAMLRGRA